MRVIHDLVYNPEHGERGRLDLVLPRAAENRPVVVVILAGIVTVVLVVVASEVL